MRGNAISDEARRQRFEEQQPIHWLQLILIESQRSNALLEMIVRRLDRLDNNIWQSGASE